MRLARLTNKKFRKKFGSPFSPLWGNIGGGPKLITLAVLGLLGLGGKALAVPVGFTAASKVSALVETDPTDTVTADFDSDGNPDVAVLMEGLTSSKAGIDILLGDGAGGFTHFEFLRVMPGAFDLVKEDFNGDGIVDLASISHSTLFTIDQIYIYLGLGGTLNNSFFGATPTVISSDATALSGVFSARFSSLVAGDFDSDGFADIIVTIPRLRRDRSYFLHGNGDGTFNKGTLVGDTGKVFLAGDLDSDGFLDFTSETGAWLNDGQGNFTLARGNAAGQVASDLDHDGFLDLIAASAPDGITVIPGFGNGTFDTFNATSYLFGTPSVIDDIKLGDVNGDQIDDILVLGRDKVFVFPGIGCGFFANVITRAAGPGPEPAFTMAVGDWNLDGAADLLLGNQSLIAPNPFASSILAVKPGNNLFNLPLSLTDPGSQVSAEGDQLSGFFIQASDPGGYALQFNATGLPPGLKMDLFTGEIFGTIQPNASQGSPYNVVVTVQNCAVQPKQQQITFSWTVDVPTAPSVPNNQVPFFTTQLANQTTPEGTPVNLTVQAKDPDPLDTLTYSATSLPTGVSINSATGVISGTVDFTAAQNSPYTVTISVTDGKALPVTQSFLWTVSNVNRVPTLVTPADQINAEGDLVFLQVNAKDLDGDILTYSASGLPVGLGIDSLTGVISGIVDFTAAQNSPYTVTISVTDGNSLPVTQSFLWTVSNVNRAPTVVKPVDQTSAEGASVNLPVQASDPDGDTLTYSATGLPKGLGIDAATGVISGTVDFTAGQSTPYHVTVTVSDGAKTASTSFLWTVSNVNRAPTLANPGNQTSSVGTRVNMQLRASDPDHDSLLYGAFGLPKGLMINHRTGMIEGTIAAEAYTRSPYHVFVATTDRKSRPVIKDFTWIVNEVVSRAPLRHPVDFLKIKELKWNRGESWLLAKGKGSPNQDVVLKDGGSGRVLQRVKVDAKGKWEAQIRPFVGVVPCSVQIELGSRVMTKRLKYAPRNCGKEITGPVRIKKAVWVNGSSVIALKGKGPRNADITLRNANSREIIGILKVPGKGKWEYKAHLAASNVPCTVSAESGRYRSKVVLRNAPKTCKP